jgi:hypothetical protein
MVNFVYQGCTGPSGGENHCPNAKTREVGRSTRLFESAQHHRLYDATREEPRIHTGRILVAIVQNLTVSARNPDDFGFDNPNCGSGIHASITPIVPDLEQALLRWRQHDTVTYKRSSAYADMGFPRVSLGQRCQPFSQQFSFELRV